MMEKEMSASQIKATIHEIKKTEGQCYGNCSTCPNQAVCYQESILLDDILIEAELRGGRTI